MEKEPANLAEVLAQYRIRLKEDIPSIKNWVHNPNLLEMPKSELERTIERKGKI